MIEKINFQQYRKLKNISLSFAPTVNVISGTNGTCKTSLLHLISNSFQAVNKSCTWVKDKKCLDIIGKINNKINPKVESLTKGDKQYNDPAFGVQGAIFTVNYLNKTSLDFRRHNSKKNNRYAVKPPYQRGTKDTLPFCPVIYLGLFRLMPYGEYQDDEFVETIEKSLPDGYQNEIIELYRKLTRINISSIHNQKMGDLKYRSEFFSDIEGIDSNTISAGEDNIFIILTALISLKYYYNSLSKRRKNTVESVLLLDEMDATLHPSLQIKMLNLFKEYSECYKIQIFFTTHSLSLIESSLRKKINVIYLIDNIRDVRLMENPDIYKIKNNLLAITSNPIFGNQKIPVFMEDDEARLFFEIILDHFSERKKGGTKNIREYFHLVNCKIGSSNLLSIFEDEYLINSIIRSICILDGDKKGSANYNKCTIALPGNESPEKLIFDYTEKLCDEDDPIWDDEGMHERGYYKAEFFVDKVKADIDNIQQAKDKRKESAKGLDRLLNKKVFNDYKPFFILFFKHWVRNPENSKELNKFYKDLYTMFHKTAEFYSINPREWDDND
jgi:Cdc6-like AAA superfamily ATPase